MVYRILYGEISQSRKEKWDNGEENPYDVLQWSKEISARDWMEFLASGKKYLREEIQIDWGSFAWKATKNELLNLCKVPGITVRGVNKLDSEIEYGVVFIEES